MSDAQNPFFEDYDAPFGAPPLDRIQPEHFLPAFQHAMNEHLARIEEVARNEEAPTFANTLEAMERAAGSLNKVSNVFYNLTSAHTNQAIQDIQAEMAPRFVHHNAAIQMNAKLFARVKALHESKDSLGLSPEQDRVLSETYTNFVRAGADLGDQAQSDLNAINEEISVLTTSFGQNSLSETNAFQLVVDNDEDLAGLSEAIKASAAETARDLGHDGKHVFTISRSSFTPFMQFVENRDLREKMFNAYTHSGDNNNENDNKVIAARIAALRVKRANLMGHKTHAEFELANRMAGTPGAVNDLLEKLWEPAIAKAGAEKEALQDCIQNEGGNFELAPWDWWYYTEKLRKQNFDLDADEIAPYFE